MRPKEWQTPPMIAKEMGIGVEKIRDEIRRGDLVAINIATDKDGERPRYLVHSNNLIAWQQSRAVDPAPKRRAVDTAPARSRRREVGSAIVEFIK